MRTPLKYPEVRSFLTQTLAYIMKEHEVEVDLEVMTDLVSNNLNDKVLDDIHQRIRDLNPIELQHLLVAIEDEKVARKEAKNGKMAPSPEKPIKKKCKRKNKVH